MNLRKEVRKANLEKWQATTPGHVAKPLRRIAEKTNVYGPKGELIMSPQYREARRAAARGDGARVQAIARSV